MSKVELISEIQLLMNEIHIIQDQIDCIMYDDEQFSDKNNIKKIRSLKKKQLDTIKYAQLLLRSLKNEASN